MNYCLSGLKFVFFFSFFFFKQFHLILGHFTDFPSSLGFPMRYLLAFLARHRGVGDVCERMWMSNWWGRVVMGDGSCTVCDGNCPTANISHSGELQNAMPCCFYSRVVPSVRVATLGTPDLLVSYFSVYLHSLLMSVDYSRGRLLCCNGHASRLLSTSWQSVVLGLARLDLFRNIFFCWILFTRNCSDSYRIGRSYSVAVGHSLSNSAYCRIVPTSTESCRLIPSM